MTPRKFAAGTTGSRGFTLAELLVSVLIISIILVVLTPVITRRISENIKITQAQNYGSKLFLFDENDSDCQAIPGVTNALECNFTVPQGVQLINAVLVSGGGGGAGATTPSYEYGKKESSTSGAKEIEIANGMENVKVSFLTGSGGGGGGGAFSQTAGSSPTSQTYYDLYNNKVVRQCKMLENTPMFITLECSFYNDFLKDTQTDVYRYTLKKCDEQKEYCFDGEWFVLEKMNGVSTFVIDKKDMGQ